MTDEHDIEAAMIRDESLALGRIPWRWARLPGLTLGVFLDHPWIWHVERYDNATGCRIRRIQPHIKAWIVQANGWLLA